MKKIFDLEIEPERARRISEIQRSREITAFIDEIVPMLSAADAARVRDAADARLIDLDPEENDLKPTFNAGDPAAEIKGRSMENATTAARPGYSMSADLERLEQSRDEIVATLEKHFATGGSVANAYDMGTRWCGTVFGMDQFEGIVNQFVEARGIPFE